MAAAKGVRQKEFGKKVTKKKTEASGKSDRRKRPENEKSDRTPFAALLLRHSEQAWQPEPMVCHVSELREPCQDELTCR